MKRIKVYQANMNCNYVFMNYEWALDEGFNMNDYSLVAEFDDDDNNDNYTILNKLWNIGNDGTLQQNFRMRSISVSDILEIDGKKYYVDSFGFQEV